MDHNSIDYGRLVDEAMHLIVYKVLLQVQKSGLPDEHHFFISFLTHHPDTKVSEALKNKYPREMTIVLQYQYENLRVEPEGFYVTLSFSGTREEIYIPFNAITTFADPSVQFGLQFREMERDESLDDLEMEVELQDHDIEEITDAIKKEIEERMKGKGKKDAKKSKGKKDSSSKKGNGNVISLDNFRK